MLLRFRMELRVRLRRSFREDGVRVAIEVAADYRSHAVDVLDEIEVVGHPLARKDPRARQKSNLCCQTHRPPVVTASRQFRRVSDFAPIASEVGFTLKPCHSSWARLSQLSCALARSGLSAQRSLLSTTGLRNCKHRLHPSKQTTKSITASTKQTIPGSRETGDWWWMRDSNPRRLSQLSYSQIPLAAWVIHPMRTRPQPHGRTRKCQEYNKERRHRNKRPPRVTLG